MMYVDNFINCLPRFICAELTQAILRDTEGGDEGVVLHDDGLHLRGRGRQVQPSPHWFTHQVARVATEYI